MIEKSANKYLLSTYYVCQKCLHCFKLLEDPCECQKDSKLSRVKNPLRGQQIYQRAFTPGHNFPILNRFLLDVDTKFGYNSNFKENFSYTTCSTCNSKLQRLKENDKKSKHKEIQKLKSSKSSNRKVQDNEVIVLDNLPNESNKKRARDHSTNRKRNRKDNGNKVIEVEVKDGNNNGKDDDGNGLAATRSGALASGSEQGGFGKPEVRPVTTRKRMLASITIPTAASKHNKHWIPSRNGIECSSNLPVSQF